MRKGFDSLAFLVQQVLRQDPLSGHLFVFRSRRSDRVKVLYWDRSGLCLWYKRLESGTFRFPDPSGPGAEIDAADLALILEGIDLAGAKRREAFVPRRSPLPAAGRDPAAEPRTSGPDLAKI
jgi:transposase